MKKTVFVSGLLGFFVIMVWMILVNGIFGFQSRMTMRPIEGEREVYDTLKEHITEPGRYACNPAPTEEDGYPGGEPAYSVLYGGVGHEAAGRLMLMQLPVYFFTPLLAAWLLSAASVRVRASFPRRVLFVAAIGALAALWSRLLEFGIGSYPVGDALTLTAHDIVLWVLVGAAVAWKTGPGREAGSGA